jgi:hypothetical protein
MMKPMYAVVTDCDEIADAINERRGAAEQYLNQSEVAGVYRAILPDGRNYHHLEWRYTAVWHAPRHDP